jgi:hypothetical protein
MQVFFKEFGQKNILNNDGVIDRVVKTATLTIDNGVDPAFEVVRIIPEIFAGTTADYIQSLANGLKAEFTKVDPVDVEESAFQEGQEL